MSAGHTIPARAKLAELATAAGYDVRTLALLAGATFPRHHKGARLGDAEIELLALGVGILADAGLDAAAVAAIAAETRRAPSSSDWRTSFWTVALALASEARPPDTHPHRP